MALESEAIVPAALSLVVADLSVFAQAASASATPIAAIELLRIHVIAGPREALKGVSPGYLAKSVRRCAQ